MVRNAFSYNIKIMSQLSNISYILVCFMIHVPKCLAITAEPNGGIDNAMCCTVSFIPCKSLAFALSCISNKTVGSPSVISINRVVSLKGRTEMIIPKDYDVTIESQTALPAVINCESSVSMLVIRSNGSGASVAFRNILIRNCGPRVPSAVLIEGPLNAEFNNCSFINNTCSGLNVRDATLTVRQSQFRNNIANRSSNSEVEFVFGKNSLGAGLGIMFAKGVANKVHIISSTFIKGVRFANFDYNDPSHGTGKTKLLSRYHGSGSGLFIVNTLASYDNSVIIKNCSFEENRGTYGGGLLVTFDQNSTRNSIWIENCTFAKNIVSLTGGGLLISSWDRAHYNMVIMKDCSIFLNSAMGGGAMKIIYNSIDPSNMNRGGSLDFQMHNCNVFDNEAESGSALRLLSNVPSGTLPQLLPKILNCTISGHSPARGSKEYPGAILSTKVGIEFHGMNRLTNNVKGSAIHISSGTLHVKGVLIFEHNMGLLGGAAYLADASRIMLYPYSYLGISNNHAKFRGGGLFVEATALLEVTYPYNPGCFLQYSEAREPPSLWKTKVEFTNNSASLKGAALFLNSLVGCLWGEDDINRQLNRTLRWSDKITYSGNFILLEGNGVKIEGPKVDIATDTYDYIVGNSNAPLKIAPGERFTLNISAIDQLGNDVYSVPVVKQILERSSNQEMVVGEQYLVLHPGKSTNPQLSLTLPGSNIYSEIAGLNATEFIRLSETQSNFLMEKNLKLETQRCYPGFLFDGNTCVCDSTILGIEKCSKGRYLYLKEGYWGGIVNGRFVTHICPSEYCKCSKKLGKAGCFYDFQKPDQFCIPGRMGTLCGRCKDGLALSLRPTECINCDGTGFILALSIFFVAIFTLLIIYFNPNIPTDLRGILFYIQVMPFLFKPNDRVGDIVTTMSGIADLGRPTEYPINTCAMPGLGNLGTTALNYSTPATVLLILILTYTLRAYIKSKRGKPFQCFFVLLVLMYKYLVETSFALLHCVDVGGRRVFFYDGSHECFRDFHLPFFIISLCVILIFVLSPTILLVIIVHRGAGKKYCCLKIETPVIDVITQGLRRHIKDELCEECRNNRMRMLTTLDNDNMELDYCSPCSKKLDESCKGCSQKANRLWLDYVGNERGWWWSVDFARRVILVAIYVFIQDWQLKQTCITITCSFIFALHCAAWPYNKMMQWANEIEAAYLFALVILANLQSMENDNIRHSVSVIILTLTYGIGGIFFVTKSVRFFREFRTKQQERPEIDCIRCTAEDLSSVVKMKHAP